MLKQSKAKQRYTTQSQVHIQKDHSLNGALGVRTNKHSSKPNIHAYATRLNTSKTFVEKQNISAFEITIFRSSLFAAFWCRIEKHPNNTDQNRLKLFHVYAFAHNTLKSKFEGLWLHFEWVADTSIRAFFYSQCSIEPIRSIEIQ